MKKDKRKNKRIPIHYITSISIEHKMISTSIENLSESGACLKIIDDPDNFIDDHIIDDEVSFTFITKDEVIIKYIGQIVRLWEKDHSKYIAVHFEDLFFF